MSETLKQPNADDLVDIGEAHHKADRLQEAEAHYRAALESDPGHPGALYFLANITYEDGRIELAAQLIEDLLRDWPDDAEAWHLRGQVAVRQNENERALEYLNRAVSIAPNYMFAYYSLGNVHIQQGNTEAALSSFRKALALDPSFIDAYRAMGNLLHLQEQFDEAIQCYRQAIGIKSDFKWGYEGIGSVLLSQKKWDEAIDVYKKAIAEKAISAVVHVGLGVAYYCKKQNDDAIACFECAISLDPNYFLAHFHLGNALSRVGKFSEAAAAYERASTFNPQDTKVLTKLAKTLLYRLHAYDKAAGVYKKLLVVDPNNPIAQHYIAACTGEAVPLRANDVYIESTFDDFAENFDGILVDALNYCGPQLIADAIKREYEVANRQFKILDAGCGTGLCGPLITGYAERLVGVDLSAGMLAKAKLRNVYDELVKSELTAYMRTKFNVFDIVLLADTLNYFGVLDEVFTAIRSAIRKGGHLFFTVESCTHDESENLLRQGYRIAPHGRYSHSEAYIRHTLNSAGFTIVNVENATLRYEDRLPVPSFVVSACAE